MDSPETFKTNIHKGIQALTHIFKILLINTVIILIILLIQHRNVSFTM